MKDGFTEISSDHIHGAKYNPLDRTIRVRFRNGYEYEVHGATAQDYQDFLNASSQGEHWHRVIKQNFGIERVK